MIRTAMVLCGVVGMLASNFCYAACNAPSEPKKVKLYEEALQKILKAKRAESLESFFNLAEELSDELLGGGGGLCPGYSVESLDEVSLEALRDRLKGLDIHVGETIQVSLNKEFFSDLAKTKGTAADIAFSKTYSEVLHEHGAEIIFRQTVTDSSACDDYDKGLIVGVHEKWHKFRADHKHAYQKQVDAQLKNAEEPLVTDFGCACGDKETVLETFESFVKKFPNAKISDQLKAKIKELKAISGNGSSVKSKGAETAGERGQTTLELKGWKFRFHCSPH